MLANETRLAILLALWEAYEPFGTTTTLSFTELRDRVGVRDSDQFNYHLERLVGHFVDAADEGYVLTEAGQTLGRAAIAGTGIVLWTTAPTPLDLDCPRCREGTVELGFGDGAIHLTCNRLRRSRRHLGARTR